MVEVHYGEGVASRADLESCAVIREDCHLVRVERSGISLDGKLMSVDVQGSGRFEASSPRVLFQSPIQVDPFTSSYCVKGDGEKFLISEPVENSKSFTVVLNWNAGLKR